VRAAAGCPALLLADQRAVGVRYLGTGGAVLDGTIEVHRTVVDDVASFFALALELRFPIERVVRASELGWDDLRLMAGNCTSGFNYRTVMDRPRLSLHALGLAFDVNTRWLPFLRRVDGAVVVEPSGATYDPSVPGTLTADHPLVGHLVALGWTWGGDWTLERDGLVDYQHFEKRYDRDGRAAMIERYGLADDVAPAARTR